MQYYKNKVFLRIIKLIQKELSYYKMIFISLMGL